MKEGLIGDEGRHNHGALGSKVVAQHEDEKGDTMDALGQQS